MQQGTEGGGIEAEVLEDEELIDEPTEEVDDGESDEEVSLESAYETAERIIKGSKEEADEEDESSDAQGDTDTSEEGVEDEGSEQIPAKRGRPKKGEEIEAPSYLPVEEKEEFNKMSRAQRRILKNALTRHQAQYTQNSMRTANAEKEAVAYNQTARDYLRDNPKLIEKGYTGPKLFQQLLGTHMTLTGKDREVAKSRWLQMGKDLNFDVSNVAAAAPSEGGQHLDISQHPEFQALQKKANTAASYVEQANQARFQNLAKSLENEIVSVQNEKRADGTYLYPKTHDAAFLQQVRPVVSAFAKTMPYSEALKKAYHAYEGIPDTGNLRQGNQATPPANNNQLNRRAASAAVSVRGSTSAPSNGQEMSIPKSALGSATDTAAWIIKNSRGG